MSDMLTVDSISDSYIPDSSASPCGECGVLVPGSGDVSDYCDCSACPAMREDMVYSATDCTYWVNPCYGHTSVMCSGCGIPTISADGMSCECDCSTCPTVKGRDGVAMDRSNINCRVLRRTAS